MAELTFDTLMNDGNFLGSEKAKMENQMILEELERKKKARSMMAVPTDDNRVKARLREIGEPITLFGERVRIFTKRIAYMFPEYRTNRLPTGENVSYMCSHKSVLHAVLTMGCKLTKSPRARAKTRYALNPSYQTLLNDFGIRKKSSTPLAHWNCYSPDAKSQSSRYLG
jgi:hypothetical protein